MPPTRAVFAVLAAALSCPMVARAQDPPQPMPIETSRPPKSSNQNVRVDVTISLKTDGKPLTKTLSMVCGDGKTALGRAGIEIPVPAQIIGTPGTPPVTSYSYKNVSVNVDAVPQILDANRVLLRLKLNFSTVYKPDGTQASQPSFGNGSHDAFGIVMDSGKPIVVTEAADGETGRAYSVEVKATILK